MTWLLPILILFAWLSGAVFITAVAETGHGKALRVIIYTVIYISLLIIAIHIAVAIHTGDYGALTPPSMKHEYPINE